MEDFEEQIILEIDKHGFGVFISAFGAAATQRLFCRANVNETRQISRSAQPFNGDEYFQPRPSAVSYNAAATGGSNLGPVSAALRDSVRQRRERWLQAAPGTKPADIPPDLLSASASGLDPDISTNAAHLQVQCISVARRYTPLEARWLHRIIDSLAVRPAWFAPDPSRVNVLALNLALDGVRRRDGG